MTYYKDTVDLLFKQTKASHELLESLVECEKQSSGKGKGPSLKLGNQPVPVKVTLARIRALTALYAIAEDSSFAANIDSLGLPSKIRSVNNWTCNWTEKEDNHPTDLGEIYSAHLYMKSTQCLEVYDRMGNELIYDTEPRLCEEIVTIIRQRNGILPRNLVKIWNR